MFYYLFHPQELRSIIQWKVWHQPVHERDEDKEAVSLRICFDLLEMTSRSFAAVIQELNHELLNPICLFYLVLRGLDTIEDDMTIPLETKEPLLRDFYTVLEEDGWTFDGNGPNEKDRDLLVKFHNVVTEMKKLKPEYRTIISDICKRMGNGMADYQQNAEHNEKGIETVEEYETYCHYVAGLVGEGLTRIFVEGDLANPALLKRPDLHESMGQFLQQTNIIRDIKEDWDDKRRFWPRAIWSKYVDNFEDLFDKQNREAALRCSSEMVLTALERADDCLFYLAGMKDQSVFNFAAIPQAMAIGTLELCFRNPDIFERNVKITKGQACGLMVRSSQNLPILYGVFKEYARKIHKKNDPRDPNFLKISIACGRIEQFIESIFPSQDPKAIVNAQGGEAAMNKEVYKNNMSPAESARQRELEKEAKQDVLYLGIAAFCVLLILTAFMMFLAWMAGARFDLAIQNMRDAIAGKARPSVASPVHGEL